jgi:hypothetical protein
MEIISVEEFDVRVSRDRKGYVMTIDALPEFRAKADRKENIREVVTRSILAYLHVVMDKKLQKKKELEARSPASRREAIRKK